MVYSNIYWVMQVQKSFVAQRFCVCEEKLVGIDGGVSELFASELGLLLPVHSHKS